MGCAARSRQGSVEWVRNTHIQPIYGGLVLADRSALASFRGVQLHPARQTDQAPYVGVLPGLLNPFTFETAEY